MSKNELSKLNLSEHFSIFAYPFLHNVKDGGKVKGLEELSPNWESWWSRFENDDDLASTLDSTYFFLPYIRKLIFPETSVLTAPPGKNYGNWVNQIKVLRQKHLDGLNDILPPYSILRLTLKKDALSPFKDFSFIGKQGNEIEGKVEWIDAVIFSSDIGFLSLKVTLSENSKSLENLIELNQSFRSIHPFNTKQSVPTFNFRGDKAEELSIKQLIEHLLKGFVSVPEEYTESEAGQIYGEKCHLFSFAGVDLNELNSQGIVYDNFDSVENLLLYEFGTCTNLYDSVCKTHCKPSKNQIENIKNESIISSWECWSGLVLRDSVVFLAKEQNEFNKFALPFIIEEDYLPLYFYTLYQKYQLYLFSDKLMQKGADVNKNLKEVRSLTKHVFTFRNRYWFNEVTRKHLGNEIYRKFKSGLGILEVYDLVNEEIIELKEFYEENNNRKIQDAVTVLTFLFVPLGAIISFWGMNFISDGTWGKFIVSSFLGMLLPYSVYNLWNWLKSKK